MNVRLTFAAAIAILVGAPLAAAAQQTTQPNLLYTIPAVLTDKAIELSHTDVPRGVTIRYTIVNRGSRAYAFEIWKKTTRPIPPNHKVRLLVHWDYRGRFVYRTFYRGKPAGPHGSVRVY